MKSFLLTFFVVIGLSNTALGDGYYVSRVSVRQSQIARGQDFVAVCDYGVYNTGLEQGALIPVRAFIMGAQDDQSQVQDGRSDDGGGNQYSESFTFRAREAGTFKIGCQVLKDGTPQAGNESSPFTISETGGPGPTPSPSPGERRRRPRR